MQTPVITLALSILALSSMLIGHDAFALPPANRPRPANSYLGYEDAHNKTKELFTTAKTASGDTVANNMRNWASISDSAVAETKVVVLAALKSTYRGFDSLTPDQLGLNLVYDMIEVKVRKADNIMQQVYINSKGEMLIDRALVPRIKVLLNEAKSAAASPAGQAVGGLDGVLNSDHFTQSVRIMLATELNITLPIDAVRVTRLDFSGGDDFVALVRLGSGANEMSLTLMPDGRFSGSSGVNQSANFHGVAATAIFGQCGSFEDISQSRP